MSMILNELQAEAVFITMCALAETKGRIGCVKFGHPTGPEVYEAPNGVICVTAAAGPWREIYHSQQEFATAYGLS